MSRTVLFAGGGTGGHLMPALAIADAMVVRDGSVRPFFVGSRRGIEANVLPQRPWPYELLPLEPIHRRRWWRNVTLPVALARVHRRVSSILDERRPVLVVGTGGYVAGPVVWAAIRRGLPCVIQEQNALPGMATRWLAGRATQVHLGFPEARRFLKVGAAVEVLDTGNPVLPPPASRPDRSSAKAALGFNPAAPLVLVVGGSQGALAINRVIESGLASGAWPSSCSLIWQTGAATHGRFAPLDDRGHVQVHAFLDPVADAYAAADLVVARAGAMTLAELCAWGLPSVLVPLPTAAAGHQLSNARALRDAGAAVLFEQHLLTGEGLAERVGGLIAEPAAMAAMGAAALARAKPQAAAEIAAAALSAL